MNWEWINAGSPDKQPNVEQSEMWQRVNKMDRRREKKGYKQLYTQPKSV